MALHCAHSDQNKKWYSNRPFCDNSMFTQFKSPGVKIRCISVCIIKWHSHLNDMEIPETKHFIPKGFEMGTTLS